MKKLLSIILALMMVSSAAVMAVSAGITYEEGPILYEDDFEEGKDESFWDGTGVFAFDDGVMSGFDDAIVGQSRYLWDPVYGAGISTTGDWPCQNEFTEWIEVRLQDLDGTSAGAGFWIQDGANAYRGYEQDRTIYNVLYYAVEYESDEALEPTNTSFVRLSSNTERREKNTPDGAFPGSDYPNHVYGELNIEGDPGFNIDENNDYVGEAIKIGVRFGKGNITAYANGKIVGTYDFETIGQLYSPILVQHNGGYVEFDNYGLAVYDYNVKAQTRTDSYKLYEGKVSVMDGENEVKVIDAAEDDAVTVVAPKVEGRKFVNWKSITIGGREITDFEKAELLYGIELGSLEDEKFTMTMPDADVVLNAKYVNGVDDRPDESEEPSESESEAPGSEKPGTEEPGDTEKPGDTEEPGDSEERPEYGITVVGGTASAAKASAGTQITVTAGEAPDGKVFDHWEVTGMIEFTNEEDKELTNPKFTFLQCEGGATLTAVFVEKSAVVPGDFTGDGKVNAKDVIGLMKAIISGDADKNPAADFNNDGKVNAKDVIALMKAIIAGK